MHRWAAGAAALALLLLSGAGTAQRGDGRVHLRPDGPDAEDGYTAPPEDLRTLDTPHFRIHWAVSTDDVASEEFVQLVETTVEEVWAAQVDGLDWPAPASDGELGGNDLIDVYLVDQGDGPFGYAENDQCECEPVSGFLVLDNDYSDYDLEPLVALQATVAHEFSHLVQFALAFDAEAWAYEATAVWLEREVYPDADARTPYLADFAAHPSLSITDFAESTGGFDRAYGAYAWNVWLAERFGPGMIRKAWVAAAQHDDHIMRGTAEALRAAGTTLVEEFVAFTAATAAWDRAGFPSEPAEYPPIAREDPLAPEQVLEVPVDHLAAYVADLPVGAEGVGEEVSVTVRGPKFVDGGVALVAIGGPNVISVADATLFDGLATVTLTGVGNADRVTLVVVNADRALARPKDPGSDRASYLFEDVVYRIGIDRDPGPPAKR